jgi:hypothetical protein
MSRLNYTYTYNEAQVRCFKEDRLEVMELDNYMQALDQWMSHRKPTVPHDENDEKF